MINNLDLIIVGDPLKEMLPTIPKEANTIVVPFDGYNKSLNQGASLGMSEYIGFCNNDLIFHPGAIDTLLKALDTYDSVSPWCPATHSQWWGKVTPQVPVISYDVGRVLAGWCIFTKRSTWEDIGGFDERLDFWCSDNAYAEQLKKKRLMHALIPKAKVTHLQSSTLNKLDQKRISELTRDEVKKFNRLYKKNLFGIGA